ncbi:MAG: VacJ family lipoprotein [Azoarcus sp.]|jgi:phospholipid-binding lipoprotein MlaA|nr:VacJ family lipoprotein [Azoarcus sp.]
MTVKTIGFVKTSGPILAAAALLAGCANTPPEDPFEHYNRAMFSFNEKLDAVVAKPVAKAYVAVTPSPVRAWIGNFFGNLNDPWVGLNNLLQGKPADALSDMMRFLVNSTMGIGGLLDIATEARLPKHDEDFGQTLGVWGFHGGPYVMLPFFGPRTLRDTLALPLDATFDDSWRFVPNIAVRNTLTALQLASERARLLGFERTLDEATLDKYRYSRDFYLQQRQFKIHDGNPPLEYEDFDLDDDSRTETPGETP